MHWVRGRCRAVWPLEVNNSFDRICATRCMFWCAAHMILPLLSGDSEQSDLTALSKSYPERIITEITRGWKRVGKKFSIRQTLRCLPVKPRREILVYDIRLLHPLFTHIYMQHWYEDKKKDAVIVQESTLSRRPHGDFCSILRQEWVKNRFLSRLSWFLFWWRFLLFDRTAAEILETAEGPLRR